LVDTPCQKGTQVSLFRTRFRGDKNEIEEDHPQPVQTTHLIGFIWRKKANLEMTSDIIGEFVLDWPVISLVHPLIRLHLVDTPCQKGTQVSLFRTRFRGDKTKL
jgi:hypothetical protein